MTMSRNGLIGTRFISCFARLNIRTPENQLRSIPSSRKGAGSASLLQQTPINFGSAKHVRTYDKITHLALHRQVVHQLQHEVFENHAQAARANLALKSQLRNGLESVIGKAQANVFEFEEALILLEQRVLRFGEN